METIDKDLEVTLSSSDLMGILTLKAGAAMLSPVIRDVIETVGVEHPIPLPNVKGEFLELIVMWMKYHFENPSASLPELKEGEHRIYRTDDLSEWDKKFVDVDLKTLIGLLVAANFLDIKELLETICKVIANMCKNKGADEICASFNMKNDFTPEEYNKCMEDNPWLAEREKSDKEKNSK